MLTIFSVQVEGRKPAILVRNVKDMGNHVSFHRSEGRKVDVVPVDVVPYDEGNLFYTGPVGKRLVNGAYVND